MKPEAPSDLLIISSSPHAHCGESVTRIMLDVVIALMPAFAMSLWLFQWQALRLAGVCVAACLLTEWLCRRAMRRASSLSDGSAVITGLLLAVARISGETAPLLFTALNNQFFSTNMNAPMANLPVVIFQFALSPYENWVRLAWGGALLITLSVLILNVVARVFLREKNRV